MISINNEGRCLVKMHCRVFEICSVPPASRPKVDYCEHYVNACSIACVTYAGLERVKNKILDKDTNDTIGDNLKEAVVYFQDKGNSRTVNMFYAKLEQLAANRRIKHKSPWLDELKKPVGSEDPGPQK